MQLPHPLGRSLTGPVVNSVTQIKADNNQTTGIRRFQVLSLCLLELSLGTADLGEQLGPSQRHLDPTEEAQIVDY